jgi:ABC-type polysaccharide/polyol phosphate transport system ATPase subunit
MPSIEFERVTKSYSRQSRTFFWKFFLEVMRGRHRNPFYALRDVSFRIEGGESVGVIGPNGAGKSTLLSLVAGLTVPESGTVRVEGRVTAMMELGAGFHPDLTGRENLMINAALVGYSRDEAERAAAAIVDFSGLGEFIDEPLRTYSSGMQLRLGFAVVAHARPDILLIDEVLAVGDQEFQGRCFARIEEIRRGGAILLCVSHAPELLARVCDRVLWIESGRLVLDGAARQVAEAYREQLAAGA